MKYSVLAVLLGLAGVGCGGSDGDTKPADCAAGSESCACYPNSTCDAGLDCRSKICVVLGASGGSSASGGSGASGMPPTAGTGDAPVSPSKANGDICATAAECSSGSCEESKVGEKHCYGDGGPDDICGDTFDCAGGICIPQSLTGTASVCNVGLTVCLDKKVSPECTAYVEDFCHLIQFCGANNSSAVPAAYASLDKCIGIECTSAMDGTGDLTPAQCLSGSNAILSGSAKCP